MRYFYMYLEIHTEHTNCRNTTETLKTPRNVSSERTSLTDRFIICNLGQLIWRELYTSDDHAPAQPEVKTWVSKNESQKLCKCTKCPAKGPFSGPSAESSSAATWGHSQGCHFSHSCVVSASCVEMLCWKVNLLPLEWSWAGDSVWSLCHEAQISGVQWNMFTRLQTVLCCSLFSLTILILLIFWYDLNSSKLLLTWLLTHVVLSLGLTLWVPPTMVLAKHVH